MDSAKSPVHALTEKQFREILKRISYVLEEFKKIVSDETIADSLEKMKRLYAVLTSLQQDEERFVATYALITFFVEHAMLDQRSIVVVTTSRGEPALGAPDSGKQKKKPN